MKNSQRENSRKLNNAGMSLLEVLIAVIILCIVSIPLLKAFVTAARTNGKAKVILKSTNAAENIMEGFKNQSLEELIDRYAASYTTSEITLIGGETVTAHQFLLKDGSLPGDYTIKVVLDPEYYPNSNAANLGEFKTVSTADSAVYAMEEKADTIIYNRFVKANYDARIAGTIVDTADLSYFARNTERVIKIVVNSTDTVKDDTGEDVQIVTVDMEVTYTVKATDVNTYLPIADQSKTVKRELFNNKDTKIPLASVFILYNPIYQTAINDADNIYVQNWNDVKFDLFVVAQKNEDETTASGVKDTYLKGNGLTLNNRLNLTIEENPLTPMGASYQGAITLRTNLHDGYPADSETIKDVSCNLVYQNTLKVAQTRANSLKYVNTHSADGMLLDGTGRDDRIFNMGVEVLDGSGNRVVYLEGTKLE